MKVTGSYSNVIGGVSEQEPFSRFDGQMSEQVNMVADPLVGLVRRQGSVLQDTASAVAVTPARWEQIKDVAKDYVNYQTAIDAEWYDIVYRKARRSPHSFPEIPLCVNKYDKVTDAPSIVDVEYHGTAQQDLAVGVSAVTTVGRYVLLAPAHKKALFTTNPMNPEFRKGGVAWIRGGAFSREYTLKFTAVNPAGGARTRHTVKYKTNPSTYPEPLDTSGIDWSDTNYQKKINDLTAAYNSAVTQYTGQAAAKIQPAFIAAQLSRLMAISLGYSDGADVGAGPAIGAPPLPPSTTSTGLVATDNSQHSVTITDWDTGNSWNETHSIMQGQGLAPVYNDSTHGFCRKCAEYGQGYYDVYLISGSNILAATVSKGWAIPEKNQEDPYSKGMVGERNVKVPWGQPLNSSATPLKYSDGYLILPTASGNWIIEDIDISDGGGDDLVRAVQKEVRNVDQLTPKHITGTVVEIKPDRGRESFGVYMKAVSTAGAADGEFSEVSWDESTPDRAVPTQLFCIGTMYNGVFHVASDPATLKAAIGIDVPQYMYREVGDEKSAPIPDIDQRYITYMGMFQDRLLIAAGNVLLFSRPGDYFNFFRRSALRIDDADPVEVYPTGSEGDSIYAAVPSGRNFLLFGDGYQYLLSGANVLTPMNAGAVMQLSSFDNESSVSPVASGNYTFYPSVGQFGTSLQEIPSAYLTDSPETSSASQQLKFYIQGNVRQLDAITNPNTVVMLTDGLPNGCYFMRYEDRPGDAGHMVNAWYKWTWSPLMGQSLGITLREGAAIVPFIRGRLQNGMVHLYYCLESFSLDARVSERPYLDSLIPRTELAQHGWHNDNPDLTPSTASMAYGRSSPYWLMGVPYRSDLEEHIQTFENLWLGLNFDAYVEPTNPVIRDQTGKANRTGTLTIGMITARCADTGGACLKRFNQYGGEERLLKQREGTFAYTSAYMGGERPVGNWSLQGYVGREVGAFRYQICAMSWMPLNIVKIDWSGQYFNSGRRV